MSDTRPSGGDAGRCGRAARVRARASVRRGGAISVLAAPPPPQRTGARRRRPLFAAPSGASRRAPRLPIAPRLGGGRARAPRSVRRPCRSHCRRSKRWGPCSATRGPPAAPARAAPRSTASPSPAPSVCSPSPRRRRRTSRRRRGDGAADRLQASRSMRSRSLWSAAPTLPADLRHAPRLDGRRGAAPLRRRASRADPAAADTALANGGGRSCRGLRRGRSASRLRATRLAGALAARGRLASRLAGRTLNKAICRSSRRRSPCAPSSASTAAWEMLAEPRGRGRGLLLGAAGRRTRRRGGPAVPPLAVRRPPSRRSSTVQHALRRTKSRRRLDAVAGGSGLSCRHRGARGMNGHGAVTGGSTREGRLVEAEPRLAALQRAAEAGGGPALAIPQVAALARLAARLGIVISRPAVAAEGEADSSSGCAPSRRQPGSRSAFPAGRRQAARSRAGPGPGCPRARPISCAPRPTGRGKPTRRCASPPSRPPPPPPRAVSQRADRQPR